LITLALAATMRGRDRRGWLLIGAGVLAWGIGQATWTYIELVLGQDRPFPGLPDAGYSLMIPLMFAGLVALPAGLPRRSGRLTVSLDAFIVMTSLATVSWFVVLGPIFSQANVSWEEKFFDLLYPAGDVLLLFAVIGGVARGWFARRNVVVGALVLGIGLFITSDLSFAFLTVNNAYQSGNLIDLGWPLGFLFATYAAVRRWAGGEAAVLRGEAGDSPRVELFLRRAPYPLVLGVAALLFFSRVAARTVDQNVFVVLALATVILVLVRQFVTLRENERLNQELRAFSRRLEIMVQERTARLGALHELAAALCSAASAAEVCEIGLRAVRDAVDGRTAALYLRSDEGWQPVAGYPTIPADGVPPTADVVERLHRQEVVVADGRAGERGTIWVPASERGLVYGCIAVLDADLARASDPQHLATIGAELGVAFEDQRRFEAVQRNEARFRSLVQNSSDSVTVIDVDGMIRYQSPAAERVFGDDPDCLLGTAVTDLLHPEDAPRARVFLAELVAQPGATAAIEWRRRGKGGWCYVETLATNLLEDPSVCGIVLNSRDISERKALEEQLTHQAFHDPLTGLANRALFRDRVEHALAQANRRGQSLAVLFLDLDNFKTVNDSLGHVTGDELLGGIAGRLQGCVRTGDTVARLGGDEFAILLEDVNAPEETTEVAERIAAALRAPFHLDGKDVFVGTSVGIALSVADMDGALEILRNADVAMYTAKARGKGRHATFEPGMHAAVVRRLELEADLRRAIERGEFVVHYQPLVELRTGQLTAVEALVRWYHPQRGLVSPSEFIPIAEETGVIVPLVRWVLLRACQDARRWQGQYPDRAPGMVNVNISARQLQEPGLVQDVAEALRESGLAPHHLVLEITESALMHDAAVAVGWLNELKKLGVQLAIDDFGTGYSSLSYLRQFPIDTLKIDKSFVDGMGQDGERSALAGAIIDLGRTLGLKTVAEGIEQPSQLAELEALGCDIGQGYHFARPLERQALEAFLEELPESMSEAVALPSTG
jgi:diguanylate cyclase (GGDEF)-like protein/PAS domain S-box-containing protein